METRIVALKDWRRNLLKLWKEAEGKEIRYIVTRYSKPIYEVTPLFQEDIEVIDRTPLH